jgi:predicted exporter
LDAEIANGNLASYDMAARYLPSAKTQRERQSRIPDAAQAQSALADALTGLPFRDDAFAPFLADLDAARRAPPLQLRDLAGTPLAASVSGLLLAHAQDATALVSLAGIRDPQSLAKLASAHGAELLDLKDASESLVVAYRERVLWALAGAAVLLALTVWIALRTPRRALRVLLPMVLTTLLILAVLRAFGVELTLFHLVALILAAGLGLDYALFFDHAGDDHADQLRTLHALVVCSLTTLLVFLLLALSSIPVLRAIGSTVTIGVVGNFVLGLLIARHDVAVSNDG